MLLLGCLLFFPLAYSLQCYNFVDHQFGGKIEHETRIVVECTNPEFCVSVDKEGSDENIYSALCANNSNSESACERIGCRNSHGGGFSTKICCCNAALCNFSSVQGYFSVFLLSIMFF